MTIIAALWLMPIGAPGDKIALILLSLFLTAGRTVKTVHDFICRSALLNCATCSSIAIAASWANSRYRLGGGPFHLAIASDWRGYPFPYEEWGFLPTGATWIEFCWTGALVDAILVGIGLFAARYFIGTTIGKAHTLILSTYSAVFTWLNVEGWLYGAPAFFIQGPNTIYDAIRQIQTATLGFPFVYLRSSGERSTWALLDNIAVGIVGWLFLYAVLRWARSSVTINPASEERRTRDQGP